MLKRILEKWHIEKWYNEASQKLTVSEVNCLDLLDTNCLLKEIKVEYREYVFSDATLLVAYDLNNKCVFCKTLKEEC